MKIFSSSVSSWLSARVASAGWQGSEKGEYQVEDFEDFEDLN
jgi:hypothetical protein